MGLLIRFAGQFVAGEEFGDAVVEAKAANARGYDAILNLLGEHYTEKKQIEATLREYHRILDAIEKDKLRASVSIKPS